MEKSATFSRSGLIDIDEKIISNLRASSAAIMPSKSCFTHSQSSLARRHISLPRSISNPVKLPSASVFENGGKDASVATLVFSCAPASSDRDATVAAMSAKTLSNVVNLKRQLARSEHCGDR